MFGSIAGLILCGEFAVMQAPMFDGLSFDPFALFNDGLRPAEVGVGGCDVIQALVIALMVVMLDERLDLTFELAEQRALTSAASVRVPSASGGRSNSRLSQSDPLPTSLADIATQPNPNVCFRPKANAWVTERDSA